MGDRQAAGLLPRPKGLLADQSDPLPASAVFGLFGPVSLVALRDEVGQNKPSSSPCDAVPEEVSSSKGRSALAIINTSQHY